MRWPWRRRQPFVESEDLAGQLIEAHHRLDKVWDRLGGRESEHRDLMLHIVELQSELMEVLESELVRARVSHQWAKDWNSKEDRGYDQL